MVELRVTDMQTARSQYYDWADRIVSILDPSMNGAWAQRDERHLMVFCHDIETDDGVPMLIPPGAALVEAVLAHTRGCAATERVLVHCHAGVSRSTAVAVAVLIQNGVAPAAAFEAIRLQRGPLFWPNQRIIELADRSLGLEGRLHRMVLAWKMAQHAALADAADPNSVFLDRLARTAGDGTEPAAC